MPRGRLLNRKVVADPEPGASLRRAGATDPGSWIYRRGIKDSLPDRRVKIQRLVGIICRASRIRTIAEYRISWLLNCRRHWGSIYRRRKIQFRRFIHSSSPSPLSCCPQKKTTDSTREGIGSGILHAFFVFLIKYASLNHRVEHIVGKHERLCLYVFQLSHDRIGPYISVFRTAPADTAKSFVLKFRKGLPVRIHNLPTQMDEYTAWRRRLHSNGQGASPRR